MVYISAAGVGARFLDFQGKVYRWLSMVIQHAAARTVTRYFKFNEHNKQTSTNISFFVHFSIDGSLRSTSYGSCYGSYGVNRGLRRGELKGAKIGD